MSERGRENDNDGQFGRQREKGLICVFLLLFFVDDELESRVCLRGEDRQLDFEVNFQGME